MKWEGELLRLLKDRLRRDRGAKMAALERYGIHIVERVPHVFPSNGHNARYLQTKATRSGHLL